MEASVVVRRLTVAAVLACAAVGAQAQAPKGPSVYVADTRILGDTKQDSTLRANVTPLNDAFAYALMSANCGSVETADDVRRRLSAERAREMTANATDASTDAAMQRIANAIAADRLAYATVSRIGSAWSVTGTVLDPRSARALGRASTTAQSVPQIPGALRRLGQQLARSAAISGSVASGGSYSAKYKSVQRIKGQSALLAMEGTIEAAPDAARASISGKTAQLLQLLLTLASGDTAAAERAMAAPPPVTAASGLWVLAKTESGETHIVDDASRSYLTLISESINEQLAQALGPIGVAFGTDMQSAIREAGLKLGAGDAGRVEARTEKMDIRSYRVQDSVWLPLENISCAEYDSAGGKPKAGVMRCGKSGKMEARVTTGERMQMDSVNGMLTEHWQLYNEVRGTIRRVGATGAFAMIPGASAPQRMDSKMVLDFWVPRGAGYCLSQQGFTAFSPMQGMFDKFDKDLGVGTNAGEQWRQFMVAMRQIPSGGVRNVTRQWYDKDIDAQEPSMISQGDVFDIRVGGVDPLRLQLPAGYRKLELPKPKATPTAADNGATAGSAGRANGAPGGDGAAKRGDADESKAGEAPAADSKGESLGEKAVKAVTDEVKSTAQETKEEAKGDLKKAVDDAKQKAKDAVKDKLKGLFKKPL